MKKIILSILFLVVSSYPVFSHGALFQTRYDFYAEELMCYSEKYWDRYFRIQDLNFDQVPDFYITDPNQGRLIILINKGNLDFEKYEFDLKRKMIRFLDLTDIDGDGDCDLIFKYDDNQCGDDSVLIYINQGNFDFVFSSAIVGADHYTGLKPGCFNQDDFPDIILVEYKHNTSLHYFIYGFYLNDGSGNFIFHDSISFKYTQWYHQLFRNCLVEDVTKDNLNDLIITSDASCRTLISVYSGDGNGSFSPIFEDSINNYFFEIFLSDFDYDGDKDLFLHGSNNQVLRLVNSGTGTGSFTNPYYYLFSMFNCDYFITDYLDFFKRNILTLRSELDLYSYRRKLYLYEADQYSQILTDEFVSCEYPVKIGGADFDNDGDIDYCVMNFNSGLISFILNRGDGKFVKPPQYQTGLYPQNIVARDFNGDGANDVATANGGSDDFTVLFNDGQGGFFNRLSYNCDSSPNGICAGDFDGDGDEDIAVVNYSFDNLSIFSNSGYGTFSSSQTLTFGPGHLNPFSVECGDLDGDGYLDIVVSLHGSSEISLLINDGTGNFTVDTFYETGQNPCALALKDIDGDNFIDILVAEEFSNTVSIFTNDGQGVFTLSDSLTGLCNPTGLAVYDFDGDSLKDVAVASAYSNSVQVFKNLGSGGFAENFSVRTGYEPWGIECADVDGDGFKDLLTVNFKTNNLAVHYGNGDLTFSEAEFYGVDSAPSCMVLGDFNGNGGADIVTGHYASDKISVLLSDVTTGVGETPGTDHGTGSISFRLLSPNIAPEWFDIELVLSNDAEVTVEIYNILGQKIKTLVRGNLSFGTHAFRWLGEDEKNERVSKGIYFILMRSGNTTQIKKIGLM